MQGLDDFLYSLAEQRYRMYHELFKFKSFAENKEDCFNRVVYLAKYEKLMDIINTLPNEIHGKLKSIENEFFKDAPYVN